MGRNSMCTIGQIKNCLEQERARIPLFFPVLLGFGILYGVHFPFFCYFKLITFTISVFLLGYIFKQLFIIFFAIGVLVAQTGGILHTNLMTHKQYLQKDIPKVGFYANVGFIEETHPTMKGMQRIIFKNVDFEEPNAGLGFIKTIKMTCSSKIIKDIKPLDSVKVFGRLSKFKNPVIPGAFDQLQYNTIMGIDAGGVAFSVKKAKKQIPSHFAEFFSLIRFELTKIISQKISGEANGIAAALLTGDKSAIKPQIRDNFIKSGIAHILAISGLHMSLVAGILFLCFSKILLYLSNCFRSIRPDIVASAITIPCTFLYLALSGFSPSATRAFIMTTISLISVAIGKKAISLKNISLAALIILIFDPFSLFHISFQLSFAAVVAIISFYETIRNHLQQVKLSKFNKYFYISILTTTIATIATTPISIATFNRFSLQNILGNLMAIPVTSFLIAPLGIINIFIGKFTNFLIKPLEMSINLMINLSAYIADLPGSNIVLKSPTVSMLYLTIVGGILLCLLKTGLKHLGTIMIAISFFHYSFVQKRPEIIILPGENNIFCMIKNENIFSNSKQKARNKIKSIAQNFGLSDDKIYKIDENDFPPSLVKNADKQGLFIWKDGTVKTLTTRRHPVCPISFCRFEKIL